MADPAVPEGLALEEIRYRGPDLSSDPGAAWAADLWAGLVNNPAGRFDRALAKAVPSLHGQDPVTVQFLSQRDGGLVSISASIDLEKPGLLLDRARAFKESFRGDEVTSMRNDPSYFAAADFDTARARLLDARAKAIDSIDGRADELDFALTSANLDWYQGYGAKLAATGPKEVDGFLDTWVLHNLEVVALRLNPADYDREAKALIEGGFEAVKAANAFWWQSR
jgi:hypothetical protein